MNLTPDQLEALRRLRYCTGWFGPDDAVLERHGLVESGKGRYGVWVRLTNKGHRHLDPSYSSPAVAAGPAKAGLSLRGASPRLCDNDASQARTKKPAIQPPAGVLHVEVLPTAGCGETDRSSPGTATRPQPVSIPALMRDLTMRLIKR